jgi:hypothetical protein
MPNTLHANTVTTSTSLVTTAETVLATLTAFNVDNPSGEGVVVTFDAIVTTGAAATGLVFRIRQGTLTGTAIFTSPTIPASASAVQPPIGFAALDTSALAINSTGLSYVVTVAQVAATGNGSVNPCTIQASSATSVEA